MALEAEELEVELIDTVSGPAGSGASALGLFEDAFSALGNAAKDVVKDLGEVGEGIGKIVEGDPQGIQDVVEGLTNIAETLVDVTAKALEAGAALSLSDTTFREDSVVVLDKLAGDGDKLYAKATTLAATLGKSKEAIIDQVKRLLGAGLKEDQLDKVEHALADFEAVRGKAGSTRLEKTFETINAKGKLDEGAIKKLASLGIQTSDVYDQLAKSTGKTVEQVKSAVKSGQIDATSGIDAILASVEKKAGGTAEKLANSIPGLLNKLQIAVAGLFDHVDIGPVKAVLKDIVDAFNGPAGKHLGESLTHLFSAIFGAFGKLGSKGGAAGVIDGIATGIDKFAAFVKAVLPSVVGAIHAVGSAIVWLGEHWKAIAVLTAPFWLPLVAGLAIIAAGLLTVTALMLPLVAAGYAVIAVFEYVADALEGALDGAGDSLSGLGDEISDGLSQAYDAAVDVVGEFLDIGAQIINGIIDGITGGASGVVDAIVNVATSAIDAAKGALGIHSPSTVAENDVGFQIPAGEARGVDRGAPMVAAAMKRSQVGAIDAAVKAGKAANDNAVHAGPVGRAGASSGPSPVGGRQQAQRAGDQHVTIHYAPSIPIVGAKSPEDAAKQATAGQKAAHAEFERSMSVFLRRVA